MRTMIRGLFAAALLGVVTLGLATTGVMLILPIIVYRRWRRKLHAVPI